MTRSEGVVQRPLSLRAPHDPIDLVGLDEVFHERPEKIPQGRMIQAGFVGPPPVNVDFRDLLEPRQILRIIDILEPAITRHAARFRLGNDFGEKVERAHIRSAEIPEDGVLKKLRMDGSIASAMKRARVVFLRAVVRQGLTWDLAPRDAAAVGEHRKHQSVDAASLLENVQGFFHAFVRERHCAHLDGDELLSRLCRRGTRGLGSRVFCGMARPRAAPEYGDGSASHVSQKATTRRAHEGLFHGIIPSWLGSRLLDNYAIAPSSP